MRHPMFLNHAEVNGLHYNIRTSTFWYIPARNVLLASL